MIKTWGVAISIIGGVYSLVGTGLKGQSQESQWVVLGLGMIVIALGFILIALSDLEKKG